METNAARPDPDDIRSLLAGADAARDSLTGRLRIPAGVVAALVAASAVQVGSAAWGIAQQTATGMVVVLGGLVAFGAAGALLLRHFRRVNGVRVDGLANQFFLGSGSPSSLLYLAGLAGAIWAAFASQWLLVAALSLVGGAGYALGTWQWWNAYRQDPVARARGASPRLLAAYALAFALGIAALVVVG